jgi:hypothetical protein
MMGASLSADSTTALPVGTFYGPRKWLLGVMTVVLLLFPCLIHTSGYEMHMVGLYVGLWLLFALLIFFLKSYEKMVLSDPAPAVPLHPTSPSKKRRRD